MSISPAWSYVQARLQARYGERLDEADWRALEAARSLDQFIDRSRATSLRRFTERLNAGMSGHAIERALRTAWRDYVAELAGWSAAEWRPAIAWTAPFPDLPVIDGLLRGEASNWAQHDAGLAQFLQRDPRVVLEKSPLKALLPAPKRELTLPARWYAHWRSLWPQGSAERRALTTLTETIKAHIARLDRAGPRTSTLPIAATWRRKSPVCSAGTPEHPLPCFAIWCWSHSISSDCAAISCAGRCSNRPRRRHEFFVRSPRNGSSW